MCNLNIIPISQCADLSLEKLTLTFYADNMLSDLLGEERVGDQLYQVVDGVDARMDRLEPLYLLSNGQGVGHVGQIALLIGHVWGVEIGITREMALKLS